MEEQGAPAMTHETDVRDHVGPAANPVLAANPVAAVNPVPGEPRVDTALRSLDTLPSRPVDEHPAVFEQVHASLVEVLGELRSDIGPADTGP